MRFSIAHATARPEGWKQTFLGARLMSAFRENVEYVLSFDPRFGEFDVEDLGTRKFVPIRLPETARKCAVDNWINAINATTGDVVLVNSDDFTFPMNWDVALSAVIGDRDPTRPFVVHVSTGSPRDAGLMTFQIFSRGLLKHWGYGLWHEYDGMYVDDDYTAHAFADPDVEIVSARHLVFEHLHYSFGKSEHDAVYAHENRSEGLDIGAKIFARRLKENFK